MKQIGILVLIAAVLLVGSCAAVMTYDDIILDKVDKDEMSITMGVGSDSIAIKIKKIFLESGWRIEAFNGPEIKKISETTETTFTQFNTRYVLIGEYKTGNSMTQGDYFDFLNLSIVDTKSNQEIFIFNAEQTAKGPGDAITVENVLKELVLRLEELY